MSTVKILAPFSGWLSPLDEVPDTVFAARMLGDGVALDPTSSVVRAPCAGRIVTLPASGHAVSIRSPEGVDILVHIGIDTVELAGRGFAVRVAEGDEVTAGQELLRFEFDTVARGAKSLRTPIVVQGDGASIETRRAPGPVIEGELLFEVRTAFQGAPSAAGNLGPQISRTLRMPLHHGLHARPAALLAQRAKSLPGRVQIQAHGRHADARSIVALMSLGIRHDDEFTISANGERARDAIEHLAHGLDEALRLETATPIVAAMTTPGPTAVAGPGELVGICAVAGFAVGRATRIERRAIEVEERGGSSAHEQAELERARSEVRSRLVLMAGSGGGTRREIVQAHLEFLDDPDLQAAALDQISAGKSAGFAWRDAIRRSIRSLELLDDPRLRERADDLLDIESHVLLALAGEGRPPVLPLPEHAVLLATDLLPSELTALDRGRLAAICLSGGGATSHVAILAAAMEIPMLVGLGPALHEIKDGTTVVVKADASRLLTAPTENMVELAHRQVSAHLARAAERRTAAQAECYALDGTRVEVFANLGNAAEAAMAAGNGAEGCGLLRTEFLFIERESAPNEDEQRSAYQQIVTALAPRPVILRLMDVGGDKPLRYLPLPHEDNPALGLRGMRTLLARPDLLRAQLRAALRVEPFGRIRLLLPMVSDVAEIRALRAEVDDLSAQLSLGAIEIGAMIETPAAALMAPHLLREVDFLSIGSNDLTQYTLAMDRGHAQLAARTDALHPAVLKLIAAAASAGVAAGKLVAVCGGMAADRFAVPILLGLGIRELSVVPGAVPATKSRVQALRTLECRDLARRCLNLSTAGEVRVLVEQFLSNQEVPP